MNRSAKIVILAALLAMSLKLYCALTTIGETDVILFYQYGKTIYEDGFTSIYQTSVSYNHTPAVGGFACLDYLLAAQFDPKGVTLFPFLLRLPGILADFIVVLVLLRFREQTGKPPTWLLVLFALSPVSFMVSGFHGNVDPVMVLFLVLAAMMCVEERPLACGLFLGLACNVKIIPLLLTPVFFFFWMHRSKKIAFGFVAASVLTCLAGWYVALIDSPLLFLRKVLGYNSYWGLWGISYWLNITSWDIFHCPAIFVMTPIQQVLVAFLKVIIILGCVMIGWRKRRATGAEFFSALAAAWILFFVFTPGACPQYMVWFAPFILLFSTSWYIVLIAASSLFLFNFYNIICHGMPWLEGDATGLVAPQWVPWSNWPWAVLIACLVCSWKRIWAVESGITPAVTSQPDRPQS